jgi:hypothetical protein
LLALRFTTQLTRLKQSLTYGQRHKVQLMPRGGAETNVFRHFYVTRD